MLSYERLKEITGCDSVLLLSEEDFLNRKFNLADGNIPIYVFRIFDFTATKAKLCEMYGCNSQAFALPCEKSCELKDLNACDECVIMPIKDYINKKVYSFSDLLEIIRRLRDEDGCPWDRAQTHKSIRGCAIEEAYELAEAVDLNSIEKMVEESGDVMLQALFHSTIAEENHEYTTTQMISDLCTKLVTRHTHIFGENKAHNPEEALGFWEQAKAKEKHQKSPMDKINSIPVTFSALLRAAKVQKYAAKAKFDFTTSEDVEAVLQSELVELKNAVSQDEKELEGGDVLFSVVNLLRKIGVDPEVALNASTTKFLRRFEYVMKRQSELGVSLEDVTLEQLEGWYQEYKKNFER